MPNWKEGQRVQVIERPVTEDDRKNNRYFTHMGGLKGTIQNIYSADEIAVKVDSESMSKVTTDVHAMSVKRMREKFLNNIAEEAKKTLTNEELNFGANYVLLLRGSDLVEL
jgi:hypothetical protein